MARKFNAPRWTSANNVTIQEIDKDSLSATGNTYAASLNAAPAVMLKLLNSPEDLAEFKRVLALKADADERKAMIAAADGKKAERKLADVLRDAKAAIALKAKGMIDTAKRDEILATLKADFPEAAPMIDKLAA